MAQNADMTVAGAEILHSKLEGAEAATPMDEEAFRAFYERTARVLWAYLSRISGSPQAADDLLQESYLRLIRSGAAFESEAHRRHYLFRIATNLARDRHRRREPEPRAVSERDPAFVRDGDVAAHMAACSDLRRALKNMKPRESAMLWLAYAEGSSHEEIGRTLGVRTGAVRVLLFRA
ncbi:MAG: RNA polymerase sigma factor, partial [Acidobacteria bacterium]